MISSRGTVSENTKCEPQSQYKQKTVIEFLTHENIKPIEIFVA